MCYVCKQKIEGYQHFDDNRNQLATGDYTTKSGKCPLFDDTVRRNADEVAKAAKQTLEQLGDKDVANRLKVDIPDVPPPRAGIELLPQHLRPGVAIYVGGAGAAGAAIMAARPWAPPLGAYRPAAAPPHRIHQLPPAPAPKKRRRRH